MGRVWGYTLVSVAVVSLISLLGVFSLSWSPARTRRASRHLVCFAVGGLFGDAFLHLLPESYARLAPPAATSLLAIGGVLAFFLLEQVLRRRGHLHPGHHLHPVVTINLVGDALHNLIDGMLIGASFVSSPALGLTTTLAVVMHEVPQELGDFGVLVHGGLPARKALVFNLLSALAAVAGAVLALAVGLGDPRFATYLLPVTAGGFIYIAGSDLVPELQRAATSRLDAAAQLALIVLGVAVMALLALAG